MCTNLGSLDLETLLGAVIDMVLQLILGKLQFGDDIKLKELRNGNETLIIHGQTEITSVPAQNPGESLGNLGVIVILLLETRGILDAAATATRGRLAHNFKHGLC